MYDVRDADGGATVRVRVSARASREALGGERDGALVVRISAPPVEGAANAAVVRFVARVLHVPPSAVQVRHGVAARDKVLHVAGLDAAALRARIEAVSVAAHDAGPAR